MRATLAGFVAFALAGAVSANAATLVGTNVTLNYIFPSAGTVFGSSVLDVVTDPTVLPCSSGGAGVCSAFVENATFTVGANTLTLAEDAGSSYELRGIQRSSVRKLGLRFWYKRIHAVDEFAGAYSGER